eukprot:CAMPEP_0180514256 /NCGR_PEP_ID=MMETSP1036_2-20121128/52626_1 /TAXON_ID=632150 /ORGANISM="Azadinium spinosum, Strain 3D9" /LENGTH=130 /DNA_ID=CAMNT_0022525653 /DNA_START=1 /DNA_END=393 /DNA_ORIENTATION=+
MASACEGCSLGRSLIATLTALREDGSLGAQEAELVRDAFGGAFAAEMAHLPRFWHVRVHGQLRSFKFSPTEANFNVASARVHAKGAAFYRVPHLRITTRSAEAVTGSSSARRRARLRKVAATRAGAGEAA